MQYQFKKHMLAAMLVGSMLQTSAFAGTKLDDATIFAIFDQAHSAEIGTGRLGYKYGHAKEVRAHAKMVATDHEAVQQMGRDLAKKLNMVPTPPDNDTSLAQQAETAEMLTAKSGVEFDQAYLHHGIITHEAVITSIKETLLPAIKNPEFKALVNKVLPGLEHHLVEAKAVAKKLGMEHH